MQKMRNLLNCAANEIRQFLNSFDTVISDCDGVLWRGEIPIAKSCDTLKQLQCLGKKTLFISNNSTMSLDEYCARFRKLGCPVNPEQIVIPSSVICWYLKKLQFRDKAFVVGTAQVRKVLKAAGFDIVKPCPDRTAENYEEFRQELHSDPDVKAVIFDFDINMNWMKIVRSIQYLKEKDVLYITGSIDNKIPFEGGTTILGPRPFVDIISKEASREPTQCAKPSAILKDYVIEKFEIDNPSRCLYIGDSFKNDMNFAGLCGFKKMWVASGVDKLESITSRQEESTNDHRDSIPDYYVKSLGHLLGSLNSLT